VSNAGKHSAGVYVLVLVLMLRLCLMLASAIISPLSIVAAVMML
jgi:hypothetical protein